MQSALIILSQLIKMLIYCAIGYILHRRKMISKEGCSALSTVLLYVILPCVIVSSFMREATPETTNALLVSILASALLVILAMGMSKLLFRKNPVDEFSSSFSNAGFMGMPLIASAFGADAVFYIAGFTAFLNILQWTYGQYILSRNSEHKIQVNVKNVLLNPLVIALAAGLIVYFTQIKLPEQITSCITTISGCNGPVAMIILGYYLSEIPFKDIITFKEGYLVTLSRLIIIPVLSILLLKLFTGIDATIKQVILIAACAPVGINVAIYAQRLNQDYHRAIIHICQSTVLCIITMPLIIWLSEII